VPVAKHNLPNALAATSSWQILPSAENAVPCVKTNHFLLRILLRLAAAPHAEIETYLQYLLERKES
jgi:hypothetical protein